MKKYSKIVLSVLFAFLFNSIVFAEVITLKTDLQDSQPKTIKNSDGTFSGLAIDLMKLIEKNSNYRFVYEKSFVPTPRIEKNIYLGDTDIHFGFGKTEEREKNVVFSEPLYELQFLLIRNSDDPVAVNSLEDIKKLGKDGVILTNQGTNTVEYIKKDLGLISDDAAKDISLNLSKLAAKRGRYYMYNNLAVLYEMNLPQFKGKFKVVPIELKKFEHYILFSKKTPVTVVQGVNATISELKKSGEWEKITNKYLKVSE